MGQPRWAARDTMPTSAGIGVLTAAIYRISSADVPAGAVMTRRRCCFSGGKMAGRLLAMKHAATAASTRRKVLGGRMNPGFESLEWNEDDACWIGCVLFAGQSIGTSIDFDVTCPNESERDAAIAAASSLLAQLSLEWETNCRRSAAEEVSHAAYSQSNYEPRNPMSANLLTR